MAEKPKKIHSENTHSQIDDEVWHYSPDAEFSSGRKPLWQFELDREDEDQSYLGAINEYSPADLPTLRPEQGIESFKARDASLSLRLAFKTEQICLDLWGGFHNAVTKERELGSLFNFVPVLLSLGIGLYFLVPAEPSFLAVTCTAFAFFILAIRTQNSGFQSLVAFGVGLIFFGMLAAQIQVWSANTPVPRSDVTAEIRGLVIAVDQNQRGSPRYLIRPVEIDSFSESELPELIRLSSSKKHPPFAVGDSIEGLGRLAPISGPAYPGGYDFSFRHWMDGLALSGFFMGAPRLSEVEVKPDFIETAALEIQQARRVISERIRVGLPGEAGDIAAALITGDRSGLSETTQEALRRSGLAHILAISGLHMALVTLTVIWLARLILVLLPGLSDRKAIKKWAIALGFFTATLYMGISGGSIATQRAWLMITVMLIASMMDRRALTMRSVSTAAIIILCLDPASLFQPGFQMSFAAVAALVVVYQDWRIWRAKRFISDHKSKQMSGITTATLFGGKYFAGLSATSLIAGFATTLFALWHFHRVAPLSVLSNLLAMPIVSLLVMPLSLLSMVLMPYGFEGLALAPLGLAIEKVVDVANFVNSYEFDFETGAKSRSFLLASAAFLICFTFLRTRLRWLAVLPLVALFILSFEKPDKPDLLIAQDGRNIAFRTGGLKQEEDQGGYTLLHPGRGKFITDIWKRAFIPNGAFETWEGTEPCTKDVCEVNFEQKRVMIVYAPEKIEFACETADVLIAPRLWWTRCKTAMPQLVINRTDLETKGSYAVYGIKANLIVQTAWPSISETGTHRPWLKRFDNVSRRFENKQKL